MKKLARIFLTVIAITSMSCEIGLGASVDTEPPSISIDTPEVDSVIRDKFLIGGSWSDDGSISELKVKIKKTDDSGIEHEYDGKLENDPEKRGSGRWSVLVEPEGEDGTRLVIDGSYQATASIKDAMGRITTQSTTFSIDNTPPVIVLTRPSTGIDSVSADTYGQTFNLEGQAADTNSVDLIEVRIYSDRECTNLVHTVNLHQVPNSINMDVAKFKRGDTENDYYKIYGESETGAGEKTFYCRIIAYDGAKRYPADGSQQSEEDLKGNAIDTYYLYKDIATSLFTNYGLKITEVYSILNGTYAKTDNSRAVNTSDIVKILESSKKTTGKFSLNPKNNPTYSVTGRNPLNLDGKDFSGSANNISNGQKVVIEVSPGLDGILLEKDSLKVYAAECDEKGNITGEKIYPALDADQPAESGTSYRFTTPVSLADGFKIGRNYVWGVEGYDQSEAKNSVECAAKAYGFHMATSGKAPELSLTEPVKGNTYIGRGGKQIFSGKVKVEAGSPVVTIYRKYTENGEVKEEAVKSFSYTESEGKETDSELEYEFTYTVESFGNKSAQFDYVIKAEQDGLVTSAERTIIYDMDPPKISMLGSSPSTANILKYDRDHEEADPEGGYVNGKVVFTFAVADDFDVVEECTYSVVRKSDGAVLSGPVKMENPTREEVTLDTQGIADGTQILLVIEAKDRSANRTVSGDEVNPTEYAYTVDQETDKPVLLPGDAASITLTKINSREAYDSQSGTKKNLATIGSTLQFKLHDDDGLKNVKIRNSAAPVTSSNQESVGWTDYTVQNLSGTDTTFSYTLPTEGGLYRFEAVVTDKNGLANEYKFVINAVKPAAEISQITSDAKVVTQENQTDWAPNKNISSLALRNWFTIEESEGPYTLYRMINSGSFPNELPASSTAEIFVKAGLTKGDDLSLYDGDAQFKDSLEVSTLTEGVNTIYYLIQDGNGRKGSIKFTQVIRDTTEPELTVDYVNTADRYNPSGSYRFRGSMTEANPDTLKACLLDENGSPVSQDTDPYEALTPALAGNGSWEWTFRADDLEDGKYKIKLVAEDKAGNKKELTSAYYLVIDPTAPDIKIWANENLNDNAGNPVSAETELTDKGNYYVNSGFTLSGTITETNVDTISLKDGNTALTFTTGGSGAGAWSYVQAQADGKHEYVLSVKDKAGNSSACSVNINIDTTDPAANNITAPDDTRTNVNAIRDDSFIFTGNASDNEGGTGVARIWYVFTKTQDAPASGYTSISASDSNSWNLPKTIDTNTSSQDTVTDGNLSEGNWYLHVKAEDRAGNVSSARTVHFDIDKSAPDLTEGGSSSDSDLGFKNESITLSGEASDTFGLASDANGTYVEITDSASSFSKKAYIGSGNAWTCSIDPAASADNLTDGKHVFIITAQDKAGKTTAVKRTVTFDTHVPTVESTMNLPNGTSFDSATVTFSGTAEDTKTQGVTTVSGLKEVKFRLANGANPSATDWTDWYDASVNGNIWTYTFSTAENAASSLPQSVFTAQGTKSISVKAKDNAGNEIAAANYVTGTFEYDTEPPVISNPVISYTDNETQKTENLTENGTVYRKVTGYTLNGQFSDTNSAVTVSARRKKDSEAIQEAAVTQDTGKNGAWNLSQGSLSQGTYKYDITATDASGRTDSFTTTVVVDTEAPQITLGIDSAAEEAVYNAQGAYSFTGSVTDDYLDSVKVQLLDGEGNAISGKDEVAINTNPSDGSWSYSVYGLGEGSYKLRITAADKAGNKNTKTSTKLLVVDKTAPVIRMKADKVLYSQNGNRVLSETELINGASYFVKDGFTLKGTITEENFASAALTGAGAAPLTFTTGGNAEGEWTYVQSKTDDGYTYKLTVSDKAGNPSEFTVNIRIDISAPSVEITAPENDTIKTGDKAITENTYIFRGTASDSGTGVSKVWYAFTHTQDKPGTESDPTSGYTSMDAGNGDWSIVRPLDSGTSASSEGNLYEGKWYLHVKVQDKAGNLSSTAVTRKFDIDKENPGLTSAVNVADAELSAGTKSVYRISDLTGEGNSASGTLEIKLTASDSHGLDENEALTITGLSETAVAVASSEITGGSWSSQFKYGPGSASETNYLADRSYTITVTAKDKSGKTTQAVHSIIIDTKKPQILTGAGDTTIDGLAHSANRWYDSSTLPVEVGTIDGTSGSGIESVQITTDDPSTVAAPNWKTASFVDGSTDRYTGTVQFTGDGSKSLWVRAKDKAGNFGDPQEISLKIDTTPASLEVYRYKIGTGSLKSAGGTVYINGTDTLTVYGNYNDENSGIQPLIFEGTKKDSSNNEYKQPSVTYSVKTAETSSDADEETTDYSVSSITDANRTSIKSWKAVFTNGTNGIISTGTLSAKGYNNAGNPGLLTEKKLFSISLDTTAPALRNLNLQTTSDNYSVYEKKNEQNQLVSYFVNNGTAERFVITGLAEDSKPEDADESEGPASGVASVSLSITDSTGTSLTPPSSTSVYFGDIKLSGFTGQATATLTVTDNAGNTSTATLPVIKFDTAGPVGIHALDDSKDSNGNAIPKDLYFRIGDQSRDDFITKNAIGEAEYDDNGKGTVIENGTVGEGADAVTYTGVPDWDEGTATVASKDKDVGGKYSGNTYGNTETVKLRGRYEDKVSTAAQAAEGSGVNLIYYKIYKTQPSAATLETFRTGYKTLADSYFSLLKTEETRRVFYTDDSDGTLKKTAADGTLKSTFTPVNGGSVTVTTASETKKKYYSDITTNYKTVISNLTAGENYVAFVAVDNVGNAALESVVTGVNESHSDYRINVDYEAPTIDVTAPATGLFTNAENNNGLTVSGTVNDNPAGVDSVKAGIRSVWLKYDDDKSHWIKASINGENWSAVIPKTVLMGLYGTPASPTSVSNVFTATATDDSGSGNSSSCSVTITIDRKAPDVEITGPAGAGTNSAGVTQVNGTINIKGFASDSNGLKENENIKLYYTDDSTKDISQWTEYTEAIDSENKWSLTVTGTGAAFTDETTYYFKVAAEDRAGNKGYSAVLALEVNKDTDRPVVKFDIVFPSDAAGSSFSSDASVIDGTISDDDGTPSLANVKYCISKTDITDVSTILDTASQNSPSWTAPASDTAFTYNQSTGRFSLKPGDGTKYIYFKITDNTATTYKTTAAASYVFESPKISDKAGIIYGAKPDSGNVTKATRIAVTTDTEAPGSKNMRFTREWVDDYSSWSNAISSEQFGGTKNTFYLGQYAYDANGVKKVYLSIPVNEEDKASSAVTAWSYTDPSTKIKTTVYTNGNQPETGTKCYPDYTPMSTGSAGEQTITSAATDHNTITIGSITYTREAYIFPLEITSIQETGSDGNHTGYYLWQTPHVQNNDRPVNVAGLASGYRSASLISFDGIRSSSNTISLGIDNTKPEITFNGPSNTDTLSGGGNITVLGTVDSKSEIYYAVSTSNTVSPDTSADVTQWEDSNGNKKNFLNNGKLNENTAGYTEGSSTYKYYQYKKVDDAGLSWYVYFDEDGEQSSEKGEHQQILNRYLTSYNITTSTALSAQDSTQFNSIVKLYVWIKAVDERGNVSEVPRLVLVDPQGDRPEISFNYPLKDADTYGGSIQLAGSARDLIGSASDGSKTGVESVWMQIIATKHRSVSGETVTYSNGGTFTTDTNGAVTSFDIEKADLDYLRANGYVIYNMKTYHDEETHTPYAGTIADGYTAADYGVRINPEGSSWNRTINENQEFDYEYTAPADATQAQIDSADKTNKVAVRIYAQDKDGKFSVQKDRYMVFDAQNPVIGSPQALYLIQSADANFETLTTAPDFKATASREYTADMFVRGQWYLIGSVNDNDKIKKLKIGNDVLVDYETTGVSAVTITNSTATKAYSTWTSADQKTVYFKYKLNTASGVGDLSFKIYTEDKATPNSGKTTKEMSIKYDNKAPVLATAGDSSYKLSPDVVQKNGFYRLESKVWEDADAASRKAQSGLDYVAFYFIRRNTTGTTEVDTIYNPMLASSNSVTVSNTTTLMGAVNEQGTSIETDIVYDSGLYWKKQTVTRNETLLNKLNVTSSANDMYIRKGGIVKIGGSVYKITERTDSDVTLSGNPPVEATTAYFAVALIADHTTPENGSTARNASTGYPLTITGDDGDGMVDYVEKSGTAYTWSAEIVSKNIPDGPIELHYVAFDAAGNYSIGIVGNNSETEYRTRVIGENKYLVETPDITEYVSLRGNAARASNILYVDGTDSVYNGDSLNNTTIANAGYRKAAFVANNSPRIASVKIWTDYSGDNHEDDDEVRIKYYAEKQVISGSDILIRAGGVTSTFIVSGNNHDYKDTDNPSNTSYVTGTAYMTIRDKTEFTPEIVGGNGNLNYKSRIGKADKLDEKTFSGLSTSWITGTNVQVEEEDYLDSTLTYVDSQGDNKKTRSGEITFGAAADEWEALGDENTTDKNGLYWFEYQIWDSTDGTTAGTDSLSAVMRIALNVDYFDTTAPTAVIQPFFWNSRTPSENSLAWDGSTPLGHIELEDDLNDDVKTFSVVTGTDAETGADITTTLGDDPKVSGKIIVRGTAYDNIRLKYLYARFTDHAGLSSYTKIGEYSSGKWVDENNNGLSGTGWSAAVEDVSVDANGHSVKWALTIDTAQVKDGAAIAGLDRAVTVFAVDNRGTAENTELISGTTIKGNVSTIGTTYKMDVVPYIASVTTSLSKANPSNPSVYDRTALGHYPVYTTFEGGTDADKTKAAPVTYETVKIDGFNIAGGTVSFANAANGGTLSTTGTITIPSAAGSGEVSISINGISSLNNINNDNASGMSGKTYSATTSYDDLNKYFYNRKPNNENNNLLNDNVIFDVWDFNRAAARPQNNSAKDIMMKVNPSADANGLIDFAFCDGDLYWSMAEGTDSSYKYWVSTADFIQCTGFAVDPNGVTYGVAAGGESDTSKADAFSFFVSKWDAPLGNRTYQADKKLRIGSTVVDDYANLAKDRFKSPSIASNGTYVYLAYFDLLTGEIRFQGGTGSENKIPDSKDSIGTLNDNFTGDTGNKKSLSAEQALLQVLADNENHSLGYSGEYVSIGIANSHVVMTWYDSKNGNLMYAYSTAANFTPGTGVNSTGWTKVETPLITGAGKYCQLTVAKNNSVHIACYDSQNGDLKYVKLADYTGASKTVCTVDSYQTVGKELTIDVAADADGNQIPYIGYWGTTPKKPRYAYLKNPTATDLDGVKDDKYTGVWECTIVPTIKVKKNGNAYVVDANGNAAVTDDAMRRINVGVWKNAGVLTYSTSDRTAPKTDGSNIKHKASYAKSKEGLCYGNGSQNAVLAYGVKYSSTQDYVETAQKR